jgi:predicted  nucleic acid-binding Zn-ribbon protein
LNFGIRFYPGFWLTIPETKPEIIKKNWIKAIEKGTKSKVSTDKYEITQFGAIIPEITEGSINIISEVVDGDSLTKLFVCVETKRDFFIERTSDEYENLSTYLNKFAKGQYLLVAKDQLSAEESKLKSLEKDLKSARKIKAGFEKSIQSSKVNITEQNDKIVGIHKELEILDIKIDNSSTLLSTMDDGDAKKAKKSELKDLQKKKKTLSKSINTSENKISKANTEIIDNTQNIKMNEATQKELTDKIISQRLTISRFQQKLKAIESY